LVVPGLIAAAHAQEKWVRIFDGKTLAGWEGRSDVFRVEDNAIVAGRLTAPTPRNEFLCSLAEYGDFVLRLEFHMPGDKMNAGVQFRSQRIPNDHEVIGYQADMGDGWWGALYDESRRNTLLARPDDAVIARALTKEGWNQYAIYARERHVRLFINGHLTVDYTEPDTALEQRGRICLQIHSGPPGEVRYRNIEIRELVPRPQIAAAPSDAVRFRTHVVTPTSSPRASRSPTSIATAGPTWSPGPIGSRARAGRRTRSASRGASPSTPSTATRSSASPSTWMATGGWTSCSSVRPGARPSGTRTPAGRAGTGRAAPSTLRSRASHRAPRT
jgi:hypothetical protein